MYIVLLQLIPSEFTIIYYLITFAIYSGSDRSNCTKNSTIWTIDPYTKRCPEEDWTVPVIAALHMLFANLLLVNLVIAKFSNTFQTVQAESEKWWYYHLYTVVTDYAVRIPSPINLILRPINLTLYLLRLDCSGKNKVADSTQTSTTDYNIKAYQRSFQKIVAFRNYKNSWRPQRRQPIKPDFSGQIKRWLRIFYVMNPVT